MNRSPDYDNHSIIFKAAGPEAVRLMLQQNNYYKAMADDAIIWLQRQADDERRYLENMETQRFGIQMVEAKKATQWARVAGWAGIIAALAAVATLIATFWTR